jgi:hypothetical protein
VTPRRLAAVGVVGVVTVIGVAYLILTLLNRNAPPPPSFAHPVTASFDPALDGRWYNRGCDVYEIVGGWLLPPDHRAPVDLTRLRAAEPPIGVTIGGRALRAQWAGSDLLRFTGGARAFSLRRGDSRCVRS